MQYFSQYTDNKHNNFNLLRLCAALIVLYTHSYGLSGHHPHAQNTPIAYFIGQLGNIGVHTFFIISGFLVTRSYSHRNNIKVFLWARFLRIYPGLCAALLFSVLIIGAYTTELNRLDYFKHQGIYQFFWVNLSLFKTELSLPGVFMHNVFPNQVNGSLWTLPGEVRLYLYVALLGLLGFFTQAWRMAFLAGVMVVAYIYRPESIPLVSDNTLYYYPALLFMIGSLIYLYKRFIPSSPLLLILLLALLVYCVQAKSEYKIVAYTVCLPYFVFWVAYNLPCLNISNKVGDYSYGLYIYAFPIQQLIISRDPTLSVDQFFGLSLICTLAVAIPSWHLLEKPALTLKSWIH